MVLPHPKKSVTVKKTHKKHDFISNFNPVQYLNKTSNKQGPFLKKNVGLPFFFHMPT